MLDRKQIAERWGRVNRELLAIERGPTKRSTKLKKVDLRDCVRRQTPPWADQIAIDELYLQARRMTRDTGIEHHVDHDIPLRGKLVSGLHVASNLRIMTGAENRAKLNAYEVS